MHPDPTEPYAPVKITKINIAASFRKELRKILFSYGVHVMSLFPDLDGVAAYIEKTAGFEG